MRYYIIAGEASGDLHSSNLMKGLYAVDPDAAIRFRGGELMEKVYNENRSSSGGKAFDYRSGAIMGITDVAKKLGTVLGGIIQCRKDIDSFKPDVVILVDYPGFNLRIARWAHSRKYRVFYYIAPKVWASREWRIRQIKKYVDRLFIVFPFEIPYFEKHGIPFTYCGNPLVDAASETLANCCEREEFRKIFKLEPDSRIVALLAGSRLAEVEVMMPLYTQTVALMGEEEQFKDIQYVIAGAPGRKPEDYGDVLYCNGADSYVIDMGGGRNASLIFGHTRELLVHSHCAVINSGTASLEAVLTDTPQVVVYKFASAFTTMIARRIIKVKYISLGNLCLDRLVFKEICQSGFTAADIADELKKLISDERYRLTMKEGYAQIRASLGKEGASKAVAGAMVEFLKNR